MSEQILRVLFRAEKGPRSPPLWENAGLARLLTHPSFLQTLAGMDRAWQEAAEAVAQEQNK